MIAPNHQAPYRSNLRNRLVDLAIVVGIALIVGALADATFGQRWFYEGCFVDECGNLVCNSQMPRPALPRNWQPPPVGRPADQTPLPKSIYAGPLPPRDAAPATSPNRERSLAPRGETSREQLDATGWTSAPSPNAPAAASQPVARPSNLSIFVLPSPSRLPSRYDDDWRHDVEGRTQNLEFAVGHVAHTEIPELRRTLDERTATLAYQIDGLEVNRASELPSSPANQKPAPQKPAPQKIIERVEIHKPSTYLELIAQIALVAGGSAATLGSGYGLYLMAARAGLKIARWFHRKHFPPRDAASAPSRPAATTYAWSSTAQAAVPVDSPPVRQSAPPETHYVEVERDWTAKAHQWADEQIARKYADHRLGTVELLIARDALVKQYLASRRS
jgi:hypothetical protein